MSKQVDVYLVASPLHFFWAFALASRFLEQRESHLVLIDQYTDKPLNLWTYLTPENTPFASQQRLEGRELSGWSKLQNRRKQFQWAHSFVNCNEITTVWIGNDRSVLGQWFIMQAKQKNKACVACYMDDGVFSYLGRSASKSISERYLDAFFKKLVYGFWYDSPMTVGVSKWIDEAWVMYPQQVNALLHSKMLVDIYPDNQGFKAITGLAKELVANAHVSLRQLTELDILITLPNQTLFSKVASYEEAMGRLLQGLQASGLKVALKYHPSAGENDPLRFKEKGFWLLPSAVSFEMFLPFLKNCTLIGDISTTVLLANYANSVKQVVIVKLTNDHSIQEMIQLCQRLSIQVLDLKQVSTLTLFLEELSQASLVKRLDDV